MVKLTRSELVEMYESMYNYKLCEKLDISDTTLISLLKKHNIPLKGKGNRTDRGKIIIEG